MMNGLTLLNHHGPLVKRKKILKIDYNSKIKLKPKLNFKNDVMTSKINQNLENQFELQKNQFCIKIKLNFKTMQLIELI